MLLEGEGEQIGLGGVVHADVEALVGSLDEAEEALFGLDGAGGEVNAPVTLGVGEGGVNPPGNQVVYHWCLVSKGRAGRGRAEVA